MIGNNSTISESLTSHSLLLETKDLSYSLNEYDASYSLDAFSEILSYDWKQSVFIEVIVLRISSEIIFD